MKLKKIIPLLALCSLGLAACKKTKTITPDPEPPATRADLSRDSIYYYAKEIYLWSDALPTYAVFNPRKYTTKSTDLLNYENELLDLTYLKINPLTGKAYEYYDSGKDSKYSYITDLADKNPVAYIHNQKSSVDLDGNGNDVGVKLGAYGTSGTGAQPFALFATAVYPGSPADKAGMTRSNRITKINGESIGANFTAEQDMINTAFTKNVVLLEYTKYVDGVAGGTFTATLIKNSYKSSPVFATKVFTAGSKKIGYLAYARFSKLSNSQPDFDAAFADFSSKGVTDLIIDLRYNGGGYINTAQYLMDMIAPSSATGSVMFSEHYNPLMQSGGATILQNQPLLDASGKIVYQNGKMLTYKDVDYSISGNTEKFIKKGALNTSSATNVVFIVSGGTASASELVINSLKPYMTVKLIGTKTYGKPVGFFPITIENKYEVFYSLFSSKNSKGEGDYYDGIVPEVVDNFDDPLFNFGEAKENYTAKAINLIAPGAIVTTANANRTMSISGKSVAVQSLGKMIPMVTGNEFVGMIDTKHTLKK